jgi:hypothetical protein
LPQGSRTRSQELARSRSSYEQLATFVVPWSHAEAVAGKLAALQLATCVPPAPHVCSPAAHEQLGSPSDPGALAANEQQMPSSSPGVVVAPG